MARYLGLTAETTHLQKDDDLMDGSQTAADRRKSREEELEALLAARTQELALAQAQIGTLFESSPLAIGTASLDGKILSGNASMARMFGYAEDELIGTKVSDFFQDLEQRKGIVERLRSGKIVQSWGQQLQRKDGSLFYGNVSESILGRGGVKR